MSEYNNYDDNSNQPSKPAQSGILPWIPLILAIVYTVSPVDLVPDVLPVLGWFELGGSGIFRPEVTKAMGVNVPVLAWGIGIDRMALMALGLNDLRELFSYDIEQVRLRKAK